MLLSLASQQINGTRIKCIILGAMQTQMLPEPLEYLDGAYARICRPNSLCRPLDRVVASRTTDIYYDDCLDGVNGALPCVSGEKY